MARLICRLPWQGSLPEASSAASIGIAGWLLPVRWSRADGLQMGVNPAALLTSIRGTRFSLEWQLSEPLTPADERQAIAALRPWFRHPQAFQLDEQPLFWINEPAQLSHPHFFRQRLGADQRPPPLLLSGRPAMHEAFDGVYERTELIPLQQLSDSQSNYESFLFHAHHRCCIDQRWQVPAVRPPDPERHNHGTAANAREWLALSVAWADLAAPTDQEGIVLLEEMSDLWQPERIIVKAPHASTTPLPWIAPKERSRGVPCGTNPALLIHGFHHDLLEQILMPLAASKDCLPVLDLYVSVPHHQLDVAGALLLQQDWPQFRLVGVENRGRDIAPFLLELLPRALAIGHPWLVKLHTKRSSQTPGGERWGRHLIESLASVAALQDLNHRFRMQRKKKILAPAGSLLPTAICLARNQHHLKQLLNRTRLDCRCFLKQRFVAGSMWAAHSSVLRPLLALPLALEDFEAEAGQIDGTLAHALERLIPALLEGEGTSIEALPGDASACPPFGHPWAHPGQA